MPQGSFTVYVVDDDESIRRALKRLLRSAGYRALTFQSAEDFLDPASTPPEKVITAWGPNVGVRDRKWNLVLDSTQQGDRRELYDLEADPAESENVYADHPDAVAEMTAFLESTLGPLPYPIKHTGDRRQAPPLGFVRR